MKRFASLVFASLTLVFAAPVPVSPAQAAGTPRNVVLIFTDDQSYESLPVMRKLMAFPESGWVNFTNAYINASVCCPSRATVLTGQYSHHTGVISNKTGNFLDDTNTLPVWLDRAGYRTGLIGKYLNGYPWDRGTGYVPPGWDYFNEGGTVGNADRRTDAAINFINGTASGEPFFLHLSYKDPHNPAKPLKRYATANVYVPPDPPNLNEADVSDKPRWVRSLPLLTQSQITAWRNERIAAQRALLGVDDGVQRIVDNLKSRGVLDNTLLIFLSDNGFSFGSHRWIDKFCVYEECSHVPFLVRHPDLTSSRTDTSLISNVDVAATISEFAGVTPGLPQDGQSLLPLVTNTATSWSNEVLLERLTGSNTKFYGIRVPGWMYAEYANGDKELYDLLNDPYQLVNVANVPAQATQQAYLAQRLQALRS